MKRTIKPGDWYPPDVTEQRFNHLLELMVTGQRTCPEKSYEANSDDCTGTQTPSRTSNGASRNVNMSPANRQLQPNKLHLLVVKG